MELTEAARRLLWQHARLIVICVLLGVGAAVAIHVGDVPMYVGSTRVQLDTPDPKNVSESAAIADGARAVVTSPAHVRKVVDEVGVSRDTLELVRHVDVKAIGASGILEVSVSDRDPRVAVDLANGLARDLIETRGRLGLGLSQELVTDLQTEIDDLTARIAQSDDRIREIEGQLAVSPNSDLLQRQRREESDHRSFLAQQRSVAQARLDTLMTGDAERQQPAIIDEASLPARRAPSSLPPDAALAGLLGLLVGLGVAAFLESFWPSVVGADAIGQLLDAPVLQVLPASRDELDSFDPTGLITNLSLAAHSAGVTLVEMVGADPNVDLMPLADLLNEQPQERIPARTASLARGRSYGSNGNGGLHDSLVSLERPRVVEQLGAALEPMEGGDAWVTGLVLVTPATVKRSALFRVTELRRISGWPLLGVIAYRGRRGQWGMARRKRQRHVDLSPASFAMPEELAKGELAKPVHR
jgi:capsular polysaccharide biosynthesis protein